MVSEEKFCTWKMRFHQDKTPIKFIPPPTHFYIAKLGFTGVYIIFLIFALKHRLWVLVTEAVLMCTHNLCFEQQLEKYQNFSANNHDFYCL